MLLEKIARKSQLKNPKMETEIQNTMQQKAQKQTELLDSEKLLLWLLPLEQDIR